MDQDETLQRFLANTQAFETNFARNIMQSLRIPEEYQPFPLGSLSIGRPMTPAERALEAPFKSNPLWTGSERMAMERALQPLEPVSTVITESNWVPAPLPDPGVPVMGPGLFQQLLGQMGRSFAEAADRALLAEMLRVPEPEPESEPEVKDPKPARLKRLLR